VSISIKGVSKDDTAYDKHITFEREGVEYSVLLHWDNMDGYDLTFSSDLIDDMPDWALEWDEDEHDGESLEYTLDCLTDQVIEGTYL